MPRLKVCIAAIATAAILAASRPTLQGKPPNILWLSIEDTGQQVEPYDAFARTPNIARLAREGVTFLEAYSHSPVCAPTRSGIITGMYPTAIGSHHMRSRVIAPPFVRAFPEYLRELGYYTTNNAKTDYNFVVPITAWDDSSRTAHWKNRPDPDQPFFSVFNFGSSHEGSVRRQHAARAKDRNAAIHDASRLPLPPYYPGTAKVREAWASYYDVVTITDRTIGEMLRELDEAGIADETLVVFWGDHGAGLARAKRWIYDSGLKVPLIMRWPGEIEPGTLRADFVQFLDLAPTMISVAGGEPPAHLHGRVILGDNQGPEPEYLYHGRDRMDERYDMIRGARNHRYLYVRNFESHRPWVQFMRTPSQGPVYQELERLKRSGGLGPLVAQFMQDSKPFEELYDVVADPHQVFNLAADSRYGETLEILREELRNWMLRTDDKGLVPEPELYRRMFLDEDSATTEVPLVSSRQEGDGTMWVSLEAQTEGASLAYRVVGSDSENQETKDRWLLYTDTVRLGSGLSLQAVSARLGFENSPPVTVKN
jgi:uncharacterized sulfatase